MKVALETLGCKVNQFESSAFLEDLARRGHEIVRFDETADLYIVHSCTVTMKAAYQTRQLLRRAHRRNPEARIAVAGCDAQIEWERLAAEKLATHIIGTHEKFDLGTWIEKAATFQNPVIAVGDSRKPRPFHRLCISQMLGERSRAYLKVQDGCDAFCSYCIVPQSRGCSRSLPLTAVLDQLNRLIEAGYREVVLTGIHLGQWGQDLNPPAGFPDLLEALRANSTRRPERIRLSSLESKEITPALLSILEREPRICPHFHVPLQSGDADILKAMGRPYSPDEYAQVIHELSRRFPDAAFGADVIAGFPGETEKHFENTYRLIERLPLTYLHVFPFSPRPGTRAARMSGRAVVDVLKARTRALRDLAQRKKRAFEKRFLGRVLHVLLEQQTEQGSWVGTTENYIRVEIPASGVWAVGDVVRVRIESQEKRGLIGIPIR